MRLPRNWKSVLNQFLKNLYEFSDDRICVFWKKKIQSYFLIMIIFLHISILLTVIILTSINTHFLDENNFPFMITLADSSLLKLLERDLKGVA